MPNTPELIAGFGRFKATYFGEDASLYESMKTGQHPKTLMIACCDSRVDPSILTGSQPGELFTVRNVANLVPPCVSAPTHHGTSSAIEYAVKGLHVQNIIVMGHANCGGINALWNSESEDDTQFIHRWVSIAQPAKKWVQLHHAQDTNDEQLRACEQRSILVSLDNLLSFDFVRKRVEEGTLTLYGWFFDLEEGNLYRYDAKTDGFELIEA